jgi:hypothetical protein
MRLLWLKGKAIPVTGREDPWGCETSRLPHVVDNRLIDGGEVVSLTRRPPFTPGIFLVLISVRSWVDPRTIVRLEGLDQLKNPMTSSRIELTTFRFVAYCRLLWFGELNTYDLKIDQIYPSKMGYSWNNNCTTIACRIYLIYILNEF